MKSYGKLKGRSARVRRNFRFYEDMRVLGRSKIVMLVGSVAVEV